MAAIDIRIELPSYSHSFTVQVAPSATVSLVKEAITAACTGGPRVEGQRIIWRGRVLRDEELVQDLWKGVDEQRILHLSVHPSAWSSSPPETQALPLEPVLPIPDPNTPYWQNGTPYTAGSPYLTPQPPYPVARDYFFNAAPLRDHPFNAAPLQTSMDVSDENPLVYILFRHNNALLEVLQSPPVPDHPPHVMDAARHKAIGIVNRFGWEWPAILDDSYPTSVLGQTGAKYKRVVLNGQEYLELTTPDASPTARQVHAVKVLAYTFPLMSLTLPNANAITNIRPSRRGLEENFLPAMLPDLNAHLQQLGADPVRVPDAMLLRPLLLPLAMLALRTLILLYVFSPTRKPVLALLIGAWVMYEVWKAVTAALVPAARAAAQAAAAPAVAAQPADNGAPAGAPAGPAGNNPQAPAPAVAAPAARAPAGRNRRPARPSDALLESTSQLNLAAEERTLRARPEDAGNASVNARPSTLHRVKSFVALFTTTFHPAVWDRRRATLSTREGQLRTEANAMERLEEVEDAEDGLPEEVRAQRHEEREKVRENREKLLAQHARRPQWVKDYVERVKAGDWADHAA